MQTEEKLRLIIEAEVARARADIQATERDLVHLAGGVDSVASRSGDVEHLGSSFGKMGLGAAGTLAPLRALSGLLPAVGGAAMATGVFKTAAAFESAREQFGILLQDAKAGDKVFANLLDFNSKTPFDQSTINSVGIQLVNARVSADKLIPVMTELGDLSKGNAEKFGTMAEVYSRIQLKGKASMEELNRVLEAGVPITAALGDVMGVTEAKVYQLVQNGQVGSNAFKAAIEKLTGAGGQFNGMMDTMSKNVEGKASTAMGNLEIIMGTLGGEFEGTTKSGLDGFIALTGSVNEVVKAAEPLISSLVGIGSGPVIFALNLTGGILQGIADGLYLIGGNADKTSGAIKHMKDVVDGTNKAWEDNLKVYQTLSTNQKRTEAETQAMQTAYANLKAMLPGVTDETLRYATATGRVAEAMKLQEVATNLASMAVQTQALGTKATTATNTIVNGLLAARENLKRAGASSLPFSLDFKLMPEDFANIDKALLNHFKETPSGWIVPLGELGFLDQATQKVIVLRKAQEMADAEAKQGDTIKAQAHRDLMADISAYMDAQKAQEDQQKVLTQGLEAFKVAVGKPTTGLIAPLAPEDLTDTEKFTAALKTYKEASDAATLANARQMMSDEDLKSGQAGLAKTFVDNTAGLKGLSAAQIEIINQVMAYIRQAQFEAVAAPTEFEAAIASYFKQVEAATRAHEVLGTSVRDLQDEEKKAGETFIELASKIAGLTPEELQFIKNLKAELDGLPSSLDEIQKSLEASMAKFGDFGKIAAKVVEALLPPDTQKDVDGFLKKYGEGFSALFDSITQTASLAFQTMDEEQTKILESEVTSLEKQKVAYEASSNKEIGILEAKGQSSVNARIHQANEEERLQAAIDKKKQELGKRQFEADKRAKMAQIAMAIATGVANTASAGVWAIPLAIGVTALGLDQEAIVASTEYPEAFDGAEITGSPDGSVLRAGEKMQSELVLPLRKDRLQALGIGGGGLTVGQMNFYLTSGDPAAFAREVRSELAKLARVGR